MRDGPRSMTILLLAAAAMSASASAGGWAGPGATFPPKPGPSDAHGDRTGRRGVDGGADAVIDRVIEFLAWAHPPESGCGPPADVELVRRWPGRIWIRYEIVCGAARRLEAVLEVRESGGIRQIHGGFEARAGAIEELLREAVTGAGPEAGPAGSGDASGGIRPPAGDEAGGIDPSRGRFVAPSAVIRTSPVPMPDRAARSRPIGPVRVELLVDVSADGVPGRVRPLRGPDPDLDMRRTAGVAVLGWRFRPARLAGRPVRSFVPVEVVFEGLPAGSEGWAHRALFIVDAVASRDRAGVEEIRARLRAGTSFEALAAASGAGVSSRPFAALEGGLVPAARMPYPVRRALHEAPVGGLVGPVEAEGLHYLMRKRGEVYYAIRSALGDEVSYQILHRLNPPPEAILKRAIETDIGEFLVETRRRAFVNEAARLMGIRQARVERGRLVIHTDVLDPREIDRLAEVVDATVRVHQRFWNGLVSLRRFEERVLVYAFARARDHDRLHRLWKGGRLEPAAGGERAAPAWSLAGEYIPASRILSIPCEEMQGHLPVPIVIHESLHMLDYESVYPAGASPSQWFEEGLATYFSFSRVDGRLAIRPGEIRRSAPIVSGETRLQFDPRVRLREYLRRVEEEGPVPLRDLLRARSGEALWAGGQAAKAYGASWTLVHFLLHGDRQRRRGAFRDYARLGGRRGGGAAGGGRWRSSDC
ncbi:MAG: hypothetical protein ACE5JH_01515 [Acidobacteriota bacterium]